MSDQPGVYVGPNPPSVAHARCTLSVAYAAFDTADDTDDVPEKRVPASATLKLVPNLSGPLLVGSTVTGVTSTVLKATAGVFDFWAIDGAHSQVVPTGWSWRATLTVDGSVWASFEFTPDSSAADPLDLGRLAVLGSAVTPPKQADLQGILDEILASASTGPAGRGITSITSSGNVATVTYTDNTTQELTLPPGQDGHTPTLTWDGTALVIDGATGPNLKGDPGVANSLSIGTVTQGAAAATITGESPSQTLNLVMPKGDPGPANTLTIGTVATGAAGSSASATVTGSAPNQTLNLAIPKGDPGAAGSPTAYELRGAGSPYGSVTPASAGIYYTDTAGTTGAWRWMSTGTTNTSWVVVFGDTGWRDVTATFQAGQTATAGRLLIRRVPQFVLIQFDALSIPTAGGNTFVTLPLGFEYDSPVNAVLLEPSATVQALGNYATTTQIRVAPGKTVSGLKTYMSAPAKPAWPITLPGTSA